MSSVRERIGEPLWSDGPGAFRPADPGERFGADLAEQDGGFEVTIVEGPGDELPALNTPWSPIGT